MAGLRFYNRSLVGFVASKICPVKYKNPVSSTNIYSDSKRVCDLIEKIPLGEDQTRASYPLARLHSMCWTLECILTPLTGLLLWLGNLIYCIVDTENKAWSSAFWKHCQTCACYWSLYIAVYASGKVKVVVFFLLMSPQLQLGERSTW